MAYLDGKTIAVTGAGRGIGRAVAMACAANGANVVVNDFGGALSGVGSDPGPAADVVEEIRAAGGQAVADTGDVTDPAAGEAMTAAAVEAFGDLHVLVNNAGILRDRVLVNMTEEEWDAVIHVHLKGHFVPTRWAATYWREQTKAGKTVKASVINTSSIQADSPSPQLPYAMTKAGIQNFTGGLAQMLGKKGIRANCVAPGPIWTPLIPATMPPEKVKTFGKDVALGRAGQPAELAPVFVLLASEDSSYMAGATVAVTGGKPLI